MVCQKGIVNYLLMNTLGSNGNDKCGQIPAFMYYF